MTLDEFEWLVRAERKAESQFRNLMDRPHTHYPILGIEELRILWIKAKARVIRAAMELPEEDLR